MVPFENQTGTTDDTSGESDESQVEQTPYFFLLNLVRYSVTAIVMCTSLVALW